jgi:haloalkane dehalogenase
MNVLRTPDTRFDDLPGYGYAPHYIDVSGGDVPGGDPAGLRLHYVDEGPRDAAPVLMLHGEPSWSFLYRHIVDAVRAAGLRAIAPDLIGFGRSDKPTSRGDYTFARHVAWVWSMIEQLDLHAITLVAQDWGGLIGLRLVAEHPERFARVLAANTDLPTGDEPVAEALVKWQRQSQSLPSFPTGKIVARSCVRPLAPAVIAAYDAPFPDESYQAGARQFPLLIPTSPDDPAAPACRRAWAALQRFDRPVLTVAGDADPYTAGFERKFHRLIPGTAGQPHIVLPGVGHFLQEDAGEELGRIVVRFATTDRGGA